MPPRQLIVKLLDRFERSNAYADIILETELREQKLSEKNKGLIQEIFFGIIRWRNRLDWIIKKIYQGQLEKTPRFIRYILQVGLYQLFINLCLDVVLGQDLNNLGLLCRLICRQRLKAVLFRLLKIGRPFDLGDDYRASRIP